MQSFIQKCRVSCSTKGLCSGLIASTLLLSLLSSCSWTQQTNLGIDTDRSVQEKTLSLVFESFEPKGQAELDRLKQDRTQQFCSTQRGLKDQSHLTQSTTQDQLAEQIRLENQALITPPKDGNYFGDFKRGELIAQDGRGKTWSDPSESPSGGNCYNCHRISKNELSYGTLGPSLYQFAKLRGINSAKDFAQASQNSSTDPLIQYTWGVLMNSKAYNVCTVMPRFGVTLNHKTQGHGGPILNEQQIKDLMSLLLDPRSPVNE